MATQPPAPAATPSSSFDQAKFDSILQAHNYVPPAQAGSAAPAQSWKTLATAPPTPSYGQRVTADVKGSVKDAASKLTATPAKGLRDTIAKGLHTAKDVTDAAVAPIAESPGFKQLGELFGAAGKGISDELMKNPHYADAATKLAAFLDKNPEIGDALGTANNVAVLAGGAEGASKLPQLADEAHGSISELLKTGPEDATKAAPPPDTAITDKIRTYFAKDNVDPRLEASAQRLEDPHGTYQNYAKQAEGAVKDVKQDAPIGTVGENIGNAYDKVGSMRRLVGKTMGDELAKVKDTPVDISAPRDQIFSELFDPAKGQLKTVATSKMTSFDKEQVGQYLHELRALGTDEKPPTAEQLDAFLSRVPEELNVAKAAKNITDTTNAERIIKGNLRAIRESLLKVPGLKPYGAARSAYSDLSDFLEEGGRHLGAKTQSGDFTRDASVAKSSAESILNGGKKDWLAKLEHLTGYKALDDAVLAIQAMKDAGDNRGLSLFKTLGESSHHPTGLPFKMLEWGAKKVAGHVIGTSAEQTAAFLKSIAKPDAKPPASGAP